MHKAGVKYRSSIYNKQGGRGISKSTTASTLARDPMEILTRQVCAQFLSLMASSTYILATRKYLPLPAITTRNPSPELRRLHHLHTFL